MVTKVSEITADSVINYMRYDTSDISAQDKTDIGNYIAIAKTFISDYTGVAEVNLDNYKSFIIVVYILCQDMYTNKTLYVEKTNLNKVVTTILDLHSVNLL